MTDMRTRQEKWSPKINMSPSCVCLLPSRLSCRPSPLFNLWSTFLPHTYTEAFSSSYSVLEAGNEGKTASQVNTVSKVLWGVRGTLSKGWANQSTKYHYHKKLLTRVMPSDADSKILVRSTYLAEWQSEGHPCPSDCLPKATLPLWMDFRHLPKSPEVHSARR